MATQVATLHTNETQPSLRRRLSPRPLRVVGAIAYVPLTKGLEAVIDAADAEFIGRWRWFASVHKTGHAYAYRTETIDGRPRSVSMHALIAGNKDMRSVDHIDGDGLNNRRANLRPATHQENMWNRKMDRRNTSGRKGVYKSKTGRFRATISHNDRTIHLGTFDTLAEASAAYTGAAKALFGRFAQTALSPRP